MRQLLLAAVVLSGTAVACTDDHGARDAKAATEPDAEHKPDAGPESDAASKPIAADPADYALALFEQPMDVGAARLADGSLLIAGFKTRHTDPETGGSCSIGTEGCLEGAAFPRGRSCVLDLVPVLANPGAVAADVEPPRYYCGRPDGEPLSPDALVFDVERASASHWENTYSASPVDAAARAVVSLDEDRAMLTDGERTWIWDIPAQSFRTLRGQDLSQKLAGHVLALDSGGVLAEGSQGESQGAALFDPDTESWAPLPGTQPAWSPYSRPAGIGQELRDGRVLFTSWDLDYRSSAAICDPTTGEFKFVMRVPTGGFAAASTLLPDGRVLLAGGYESDGGFDHIVTESTWTYDVDADRWRALPPLARPRVGGILLNDTQGVFLIGGVSERFCAAECWVPEVEKLDEVTQRFEVVGELALGGTWVYAERIGDELLTVDARGVFLQPFPY